MAHSMRMVVDLPAPLGPSTPKISPRFTCSETSRTACSEPNWRESERVSMMSSLMSIGSAQEHERGHAGAQLLLRIRDAHAHAHHQRGALLLAEQVTRRKLGATRDVLDPA